MLKIAFHPIYTLPLPEKHRFPMEKYDLLPRQLLFEGTCEEINFFEPEFPSMEYVYLAHNKEYVDRFRRMELTPKEVRKIGFPLTDQLIDREFILANGTMKACDYALKNGIAMNIAGGTHHAFSGHGEAFCMLNDQAIAAHYLIHTQKAKKILIIDLDVHQGNGTAEIFKENPNVFTFSTHGKTNYPFRKEKSDLDIAFEDNTRDEEFLQKIKEIIPKLIEKQKPDFIFYLCGVDILESDKLGKLGMTIEGCKERDRFVLQTCQDYEIPIQCSMGGGYSPDIKIIVDAHANTFRLAQEIYF